MTVDHWEAMFDAKYLRWFDIVEKGEVEVTIEKVEPEELTMKGGIKKVAPVVTVKGAKKQFVLNKTNSNSIAILHGNQPSKWVGKKITLFVTKTRMWDEETKKMVTKDCIRIKTPNN